MPASMLMGIIFNSLYFLSRTIPEEVSLEEPLVSMI
jgi:hypothetical protein